MFQDEPEIRKRVKIAVGLLISAKLLNVSVPFLFKYAVDFFNTGATLGMATAPATVATVGTSILLGCKSKKKLKIISNNFGT